MPPRAICIRFIDDRGQRLPSGRDPDDSVDDVVRFLNTVLGRRHESRGTLPTVRATGDQDARAVQ
jgi:hypothetical protein